MESLDDSIVIRDSVDKVPRIVIKNIEKDLSKDEIKSAIKLQNSELLSENAVIKAEYTFGNDTAVFQNAIISTDKETRNKFKCTA